MNKPKYLPISIILVISLAVAGLAFNVSARPLSLGISPTLTVLLNDSVLGGAAVTNAGSTTTDGNVAVSPGSSITGFPPGLAGGNNATHLLIPPAADPAQAEALSVFGALAQTCDQSFPDGTDLSTTNFGSGVGNVPPGVYCSEGSFLLTTTLHLTGSGVWIFRTVSTLITSSGSSVTGGDPCNVWWRIGSSTTLGTTTSFIGTVISQNGVNAMQTGATLNGRFLALSAGTVTLDSNTITTPVCAAATNTPTRTPTNTPTNTPTRTPTNTPRPVPTNTPLPAVLPASGFAPQRVSVLAAQPAKKAYADLGDLWLEIPRLGVQMPIVGVPQTDGEWDVSWLGNDAGWLNGTAFPTWAGNSVLAGHVYDANGNPGPFVHLNWLWWGDQVIVHAWGAQYIYEVREVLQVAPGATSAVIKHEQLPWVTLVTCRGYDEATNSYKYRVAVGAVLVEVK
jgi:LPXTG-site transpeptidase (sortase) family protein